MPEEADAAGYAAVGRRTSGAPSKRTCPTSSTAPAGTRSALPISHMPGGGGVGVGNNSPFGNQFGAYADILRNLVAQNWKTSDIDARITPRPSVAVTFTLHRDGSVTGMSQSRRRAAIPRWIFPRSAPSWTLRRFPQLPPQFPKNQAEIEFRLRTEAVEEPMMKKLICSRCVGRSPVRVLTAQQNRPSSMSSEERHAGHRHPRSPRLGRRAEASWPPSTRPSGTTWRFPGSSKIVPKTSLPALRPAAALRFSAARLASAARHAADAAAASPQPTNGGGRWMQDWSSPPAQANYLAFGYTAAQNGVLVLQGWLYDLSQGTAGQRAVDRQSLSRHAWTKPARAKSRTNSPPISSPCSAANRSSAPYLFHLRPHRPQGNLGDGSRWQESAPDHAFQHHFHLSDCISRTARKSHLLAGRSGNPGIFVFSVDPVRDLRFYNQGASVNQARSFTPDGKQIVYASSAGTGGVAGFSSRIWTERGFGRSLRPAPSKPSPK